MLDETYKIKLPEPEEKELTNHVRSLTRDKKAALENLLFEAIMLVIGDQDEDQDFHELGYVNPRIFGEREREREREGGNLSFTIIFFFISVP